MARSSLPPAVRALLAREAVELDHAEPGGEPGCWRVRGLRWVAVAVAGRDAPLHVALPVAGEVGRGARGRYEARLPQPTPDELAEAAAYAASLAAHGQIGARGSASHQIVRDAQGREKLVRRGFSAR